MRYQRKVRLQSDVDLVSVDDALELIKDYFKSKEQIYSKKTIYNKIHDGTLKRYGPFHKLMLDREEVLQKLCKHYE